VINKDKMEKLMPGLTGDFWFSLRPTQKSLSGETLA
jgi:hypothetical protein